VDAHTVDAGKVLVAMVGHNLHTHSRYGSLGLGLKGLDVREVVCGGGDSVNVVRSLSHHLLLTILAAGPIPQHVAFIMDGNRRYARQNGNDVVQGHVDGFSALRQLLEICLRLNIRCVTVYAFAINNFKRTPGEVEALMNLAESKLLELTQNGELLDQYGVRLNVLGKTELLPERVQKAVAEAEALTRHNDRAIFNLAMPYDSSDEITTAIQSAVNDGLKSQGSGPITEKDIDNNLMTSQANSPPLDILVRTSGVRRLSDFLTWQCSENTQIQFSSKYWPEFGLWDFIPILFDYQAKVWSSK